MKKIISAVIILLILGAVIFFVFKPELGSRTLVRKRITTAAFNEAIGLLEKRKDKLALAEFEKVLLVEPENIDALWGRAEVLRREYKFVEAETIFQETLKQDPQYIPSLISICYIRYHDDKLNEAMKMAKGLLRRRDIDIKNKAIVYMLVASINARRSAKGGFFSKLSYGTQIKGYFQKALDLAPELPEAHLGLGSFYLLAPKIAGGNINKAIEELGRAVILAPDFATANARLAQAYKAKGEVNKYKFYIERTKVLDPENEVLAKLLKDE